MTLDEALQYTIPTKNGTEITLQQSIKMCVTGELQQRFKARLVNIIKENNGELALACRIVFNALRDGTLKFPQAQEN